MIINDLYIYVNVNQLHALKIAYLPISCFHEPVDLSTREFCRVQRCNAEVPVVYCGDHVGFVHTLPWFHPNEPWVRHWSSLIVLRVSAVRELFHLPWELNMKINTKYIVEYMVVHTLHITNCDITNCLTRSIIKFHSCQIDKKIVNQNLFQKKFRITWYIYLKFTVFFKN